MLTNYIKSAYAPCLGGLFHYSKQSHIFCKGKSRSRSDTFGVIGLKHTFCKTSLAPLSWNGRFWKGRKEILRPVGTSDHVSFLKCSSKGMLSFPIHQGGCREWTGCSCLILSATRKPQYRSWADLGAIFLYCPSAMIHNPHLAHSWVHAVLEMYCWSCNTCSEGKNA